MFTAMLHRLALVMALLLPLVLSAPVQAESDQYQQAQVPDYLMHKPKSYTPLLERPLAFEDDFEGYPIKKWTKEGKRYGKWELVYYGTSKPDEIAVGVERDLYHGGKAFTARPEFVPNDTRAVLVKTNQAFSGDIEVMADMVTVSQNRGGAKPAGSKMEGILGWMSRQFGKHKGVGNTWESAWLIWNYIDDDHFNYVYLKPGLAGGELGKRDTIVRGDHGCSVEGGQCHMFTLNFPAVALGEYAHIRVVQVGPRISIYINGKTVVKDFIDDFADGPNTSGHVALYTEDAYIHFDNIKVRALAMNKPASRLARQGEIVAPKPVGLAVGATGRQLMDKVNEATAAARAAANSAAKASAAAQVAVRTAEDATAAARRASLAAASARQAAEMASRAASEVSAAVGR